GTNRSAMPMTTAARRAPSTVTDMPGTKNCAAHTTSAAMINPTTPRPKGDAFLPIVASTTQPSAAMTSAASSACQNVSGENPGTTSPTNISTSALGGEPRGLDR